MPTCWGCRCSQAFGHCGGGPKTSYCTDYPGGGCTDGDVGAVGIEDMTSEQTEACQTKFYGPRDKDGNLVLEEPGWLAQAGLAKGDTLLGVNDLHYYDEKQRQLILTHNFPESELLIRYRQAATDTVLSSQIARPHTGE